PPSLLGACRRNALARAMRRVQLQGGARGPHARRTPCTFHSEGGFAPLPNLPPQESLRRQSRRSKAEHFHVGRRATNEDSHGPAIGGPLRARVSPALRTGGGLGGGRRGPLR